MRTVPVVTHPEATHHVDRVVGGRYDSRLTAAGEGAAAAVAGALRSRISEGVDVEVFSSAFRRTV
ncbi:histidine phosphatase family protein [Nocardia testacea]|uniref:histidine phosphatase family protein n=1 Tax=Nocardia testacea TaxID=248551 RepID=UPI003C2BBEFC